MPTIRANDLEIGYEVRRGRAAAGHAPRRGDVRRARRSAGSCRRCRPAFRVYPPRRARPRPDALGRRRRASAPTWLVDDLEAFVDALGLATFHLLGYSMGGDDRARVRGARHRSGCGRWWSSGITTEREPRASRRRRLMDPERIERDDPAWAADLARSHDPVQGAGAWRAAPAGDRRGRRQPATADARRAPRDRRPRRSSCAAIATRSCRSPRLRTLARQVRDGRLLVAPGRRPRCRQRAAGARRRGALLGFYRSTDVARAARRRRHAAPEDAP